MSDTDKEEIIQEIHRLQQENEELKCKIKSYTKALEIAIELASSYAERLSPSFGKIRGKSKLKPPKGR